MNRKEIFNTIHTDLHYSPFKHLLFNCLFFKNMKLIVKNYKGIDSIKRVMGYRVDSHGLSWVSNKNM